MAAIGALAACPPHFHSLHKSAGWERRPAGAPLAVPYDGPSMGALRSGVRSPPALVIAPRGIHRPSSRGPVRATAQSPSSAPSEPGSTGAPVPEDSPKAPGPRETVPGRRQQAESTDWIASTLTRRFGLGAGLVWVGFLAFGVISEQIKTRTEVYLEEQGTMDVEDAPEVVTPEGLRYTDLRRGGGASPLRGDLVLVGLSGKIYGADSFFVDTYTRGNRDIVFAFGPKPYVRGVCEGLEVAMQGMKAGGKRRIIVPPALGFGSEGADLGGGVAVPGDAVLEYVVELKRVSIPPS